MYIPTYVHTYTHTHRHAHILYSDFSHTCMSHHTARVMSCGELHFLCTMMSQHISLIIISQHVYVHMMMYFLFIHLRLHIGRGGVGIGVCTRMHMYMYLCRYMYVCILHFFMSLYRHAAYKFVHLQKILTVQAFGAYGVGCGV